MKTQCEMVIEYIEDNGSITSMEAFQDLGITRLSARIHDLKEKGYDIIGHDVKHVGKNGRVCHFTRYFIND